MSAALSNRMPGKVRSLFPSRGYGFIYCLLIDRDVFFSIPDGKTNLLRGDEVMFNLYFDGRSYKAENVRKCCCQ